MIEPWIQKRITVICFVLTTLVSLSHGNMLDLIQKLKRKEVLKSDLVVRTMLNVDRRHYCPNTPRPYDDSPQAIGYGATISAPHMHALVLEVLKDHLVSGNRALDIGSGSGYVTVCMAIMLGDGGIATGIEHIPELVTKAANNTNTHHKSLLTSGRIKYIIGDGRLGYLKGGPYDVIHCGATFNKMPLEIIDQLKPGGRFVGPIGSTNDTQYLTVVDKGLDGVIKEEKIAGVMYMPMMGIKEQLG